MANYIATDTDLTAVANAIRTKGGTAAQLEFPSGFANAINAIPTVGLSQTVAALLMSILNAGTYSPSQADNLAALATIIIIITWSQSGTTLVGTGSPDIRSITQSGTTLALT